VKPYLDFTIDTKIQILVKDVKIMAYLKNLIDIAPFYLFPPDLFPIIPSPNLNTIPAQEFEVSLENI